MSVYGVVEEMECGLGGSIMRCRGSWEECMDYLRQHEGEDFWSECSKNLAEQCDAEECPYGCDEEGVPTGICPGQTLVLSTWNDAAHIEHSLVCREVP